MSTNTRLVKTTPDRVWDVLADGWLYPLWVVGASRIRDVEPAWPAVGAKIHHSVGAWPLLLDDHTEVLECSPGSMLRLKARVWPAGEAEVTVRLRASGSNTEVEIEEEARSGPAALIPGALKHPMLAWRNTEALRRLAFVAEGRTAPTPE